MKTTLASALRLLAVAMLLFAMLAVPPTVHAADKVSAAETRREIAALLALLRESDCRFQRNGRWHDAGRAADHLQRKLDYAVGRGMAVGTTEAFIEQAATRNSFTGRAYKVQCPGVASVESADWFRALLKDLRKP